MATIICEQCRVERTRCPSNTKLCRDCAFLRDLTYYASSHRKCATEACAAQFTPMHRNDRLCGDCSLSPHRGPCSWCSTETGELIARDIPVCLCCAKDIGRRRQLVLRLRGKQADRLALAGVPA